MLLLSVIFFISLFILFYSYIGYGFLVWLLLSAKKITSRKKMVPSLAPFLPDVTIIIAAYNEETFIEEKIANTLALDYPADKLRILFVTDGSTDATPLLVSNYPQIQHLHKPGRSGKIAAMHRAMSFVQTGIVVFSDANTLLNAQSIRNIMRHYKNDAVGGVAGEKKVIAAGHAAGNGEGLYWKYESFLKQLDSDFYTVVGAAGELFSIRTALYEYPGDNVLLDDFIISLRICQKGYRVVYEREAYAIESASLSIKEEQKRKIRISAGGFQSIYMLRSLLNIFKYPRLSFQYISHRVLRWAVCPFLLPIAAISNIALVFLAPHAIYQLLLFGQILFYLLAFIGWTLAASGKKVNTLYALYYFLFMQYALYRGLSRYISGTQTVLWEKAKRAPSVTV